MRCFSLIIVLLIRCSHASKVDTAIGALDKNLYDHIKYQLDLYKSSGLAHKIINTYCGTYVLHKYVHETERNIGNECDYELWKNSVAVNKPACLCRRRGLPQIKYTGLFARLLIVDRQKVFLTPENAAYFIAANKTVHLLLDSSKAIYHYEFVKDGITSSGFVNSISEISKLSNTKGRLLRCENFLSFVQRKMVTDKISFTLINSYLSGTALTINYASRGVAGFIVDDGLPVVPIQYLPFP